MEKTKKRLAQYWDDIFLKKIPRKVHFKKIEEEIKEHFGLLGFMMKRILLPLILIFLIFGLILGNNILSSIFISLLVFLYSNFLPDIDFLVRTTERKEKESLWYEKYFFLFFAPIVVYYIMLGKAKPLYSIEHRCFHNIKSMLAWGIFLFFVGNIFWDETIKIIMLPLFGIVGFVFHLIIDEIVIGSKLIKERIAKKDS